MQNSQLRFLKIGHQAITSGYFSAVLLFMLYLFTLAQSPVLGDPSEYTFVAHILGIAHPPGYAFFTLLGKLFQTVVPIGEISWRMHLLSALSGVASAIFVYGTIHTVTQHRVSAVFAAWIVGTAVNQWQHAIHANPHTVTATFLAANLYFLTRWWVSSQQLVVNPPPSERWLLLFCLSAGLGVTHHPLTLFAFPAYTLFIFWVQPQLLRNGRTLIKMVLCTLLGLTVWLYFPIRSSMIPPFGPVTMNTLDGFLTHVLGRGLAENLPYFTLADIPDRLLVFWSILRLQYSLLVITLPLVALFPRLQNPLITRPLLLYVSAFLCVFAFVISLKAQDVMAYLLGPLLVVGLLAGLGFYRLVLFADRLREKKILWAILFTVFLLGPGWQIVFNLPRVSLRHYTEGEQYIEAVFTQFIGTGEDATLLNDWEHMTPLWYAQFVQGRWLETADVQPLLVAAGSANPWLEAVFQYLPGGPVYLSSYRRSIVDAGFRLRPVGPFYRVVEPGDVTIPPDLIPVSVVGAEIEVVGYVWGETAVSAGDYVSLTLAMRAPLIPTAYYVPVLHLGDINYTFTTDSHLTTPTWLPGEVIVERFDFALPHTLAQGIYPVTLGLKNLSHNEDVVLNLNLGVLQINDGDQIVDTARLLANFRQRVGLVRATAVGENGRFAAPWHEPLMTHPGAEIQLTLTWECLAAPEQSYTIFVHLIDAANHPLVALDYTPLGGSTPTYLWIPKWLPGQQLLDPYRLQVPPNLPPGTYAIEVGLYETAYEPASGRRLHISDEHGNLIGDRYILGMVEVK